MSSACIVEDGRYEIRTASGESLVLTQREATLFREALRHGIIKDLGRRLQKPDQPDEVIVCDLRFSFGDAQLVYNQLGDLPRLLMWYPSVDWLREGF